MAKTETLHLWLVFGSVLAGVVAVLIAFGVSVAAFRGGSNPAETIVSIVGPVYTVIGTLVGLVAGHQLGARGKEQAEERAVRASDEEAKAKEMAARAQGDREALKGWLRGQPKVLDQARRAYPAMFE